MGSIICCLSTDDSYEHEHPAAGCSQFLPCCFRCFPMCDELFPRRGRITHSAELGTAPLRSASSNDDNSSFDTFQSPPRPLAFDDPRCSQPQHHIDGKPLGQLNNESQSLKCKTASQTGNAGKKGKSDTSKYEKLPKADQQLEMTSGVTFSTCEDEDTCPVCLEEYIPENPRITLQCAHDYHLSCIYEWMERSETCPVCGKVMLFEEEE